MYSRELFEIVKLNQQLSNIMQKDLLRNLAEQKRLIDAFKPINEHAALLREYKNKIEAIRPIPEEIFNQIEKERALIAQFERPYRLILEEVDKIRFLPVWDQIKKIAVESKELLGWYEPHKKIWEEISKKLDLMGPAFGISIGRIGDTNQPNVLIRDYTNTNNEDSNREFPASAIKDVVGLPNLVAGIDHHDACEFLNFLSQYPMLGLNHKVGGKLFEVIKELEKVELRNRYFYRGRSWNDNQCIPYVEDELFQAPFGVPSQGRFNPNGLSTLYFSDSEETVLGELEANSIQKISIIKVTNLRPLNVIDFSNDTSPIISLCNKPISNKSALNTEYLVPNFLGQCCKYHGINGIVYQSATRASTQNFAFFDIYKDSFQTVELINKG